MTNLKCKGCHGTLCKACLGIKHLAVAQKGQVQDRSAEPVLSLDEGLTTKPAPTSMQITQ